MKNVFPITENPNDSRIETKFKSRIVRDVRYCIETEFGAAFLKSTKNEIL